MRPVLVLPLLVAACLPPLDPPQEPILSSEDLPYANSGPSQPSIWFDDAAGQWVMWFETRHGSLTDACPDGEWGIRRATSPDGLTWTAESGFAIRPAAGTWYGCAASHPEVLHDGEQWHMWFKGHIEADSCTDESPWTCPPLSGLTLVGVGHATSPDGIDWTIEQVPTFETYVGGFPAVAKKGSRYHIAMVLPRPGTDDDRDIWHASSIDGFNWTEPVQVLMPEEASGGRDRWSAPAMGCDDDGVVLWSKGEVLRSNAPIRVDVARFTSTDGTAFAEDGEPFAVFDLDPPSYRYDRQPWGSLQAFEVGGEVAMVYSRVAPGPVSETGLAMQGEELPTSLDGSTFGGRVCP